MRSLVIVLPLEGMEPLLLQQKVSGGRNDRSFLECEMEALMSSILLGMPRLDPLDSDSQPEPPNGQFAEPKQAVRRGKRDSIVGADRRR